VPLADVDDDELPVLDVRSDPFSQDPHQVLRELRDRGPLARSHRGIEVLSFELCASVLSSDDFDTLPLEHFRQKGAPQSLIDFVDHGLLLNMGRERHDLLRRAMLRAFTIRRMEEQRDLMRGVGARLLEPLLERGNCDFVADFTERYPMEVLCRLIGVPPEDIPVFQRAAIDLHLMGAVPLAPGFGRIDDALNVLRDFVSGLVAARTTRPEDDLVSALTRAQTDETNLAEEDVVWSLVNLLFAGQDTTRYQLASTLAVLAAVPGMWDFLAADPDTIPGALEEAMRLRPVSQFVVRQAGAPAEAGGFRFPANRRVVVNLLAASRDPGAFDAPATFELGRSPAYRLPFGWGRHYCLGHALARTEMCEALSLLLESVADPRVDGRVVEASPAGMLGGPESLPVTWTARS
jgi:cytochrome P450